MQEMSPGRDGQLEADKKIDRWRMALDRVTSTYGDAGELDQAEVLYLRMLSWREGTQQHQAGQSALAEGMFQRSMAYSSVDDATWFLRGLKPDDGHLVADIVPLLALGEQVAAKAAVAAWTVALRPKHRGELSERGGLELLAKVVAQHPDNPELAAAGCGALRLLCQGHASVAQNRQTLATRLDGPATLVTAMRIHRSDMEVQREASGALGAVAEDFQVGAASVVAKDGIMACLEAIVACADQRTGDAACKALAAICSHRAGVGSGSLADDGTDGEGPVDAQRPDSDWQVALRSECSRGLRFCLQQLDEQLEEGDRVVLQSLLWAIMIFLNDSSVRRHGLDMVASVVNCMNKYQGHALIQVRACGILWRLTAGHPAREEAVHKVAVAGGIRPICQAMRDLPCSMELQQLAIGAIRNLAFGNDLNKTLVVRAGGLAATVMGMKRYPKDARLQEQAIGALTSLCDTVGRAAVCARAGGIEAIIAALKRHASVGHVAELGCIILCMFCDDQQLKHIVVQCGALQIAKALSRTGNSEAQQWGCELLRDLSDK